MHALLASLLLSTAAPAPPTIVPRATWDPDGVPAGVRYPRALSRTLTTIVVHHSDFYDAPGPVGIKAYHLEVSRFADIGYHFVIGADGTIYAARPLERMGAHAGVTREAIRGDRTKDPDWGSVGIVLDGNFDTHEPSPAQLDALRALIADLKRRYPRIEGVIGHREVRGRSEHAGWHPQGAPTVCPGDALFRWLERERSAATAAPIDSGE